MHSTPNEMRNRRLYRHYINHRHGQTFEVEPRSYTYSHHDSSSTIGNQDEDALIRRIERAFTYVGRTIGFK